MGGGSAGTSYRVIGAQGAGAAAVVDELHPQPYNCRKDLVQTAWLGVLGQQLLGVDCVADVFCGRHPSPVAGPERNLASLPCHMGDRKSTRLNSSHLVISYAVFC